MILSEGKRACSSNCQVGLPWSFITIRCINGVEKNILVALEGMKCCMGSGGD
jgi:hypothetical protein